MKKEDILEMSRKENKNRDLAEFEVIVQAGSISGRVGACVCCLISVLSFSIADMLLYSPWIIYFSILGSHNLVRYTKLRVKSDLGLTILYFVMCALALVFFILRLVEARG